MLLVDHNSVITPSVDTKVPLPHDDLLPTLKAREAKIAFTMETAIGDASTTAFEPTVDPEAHHIPDGLTWGFHTEKKSNVTMQDGSHDGNASNSDTDSESETEQSLHRWRIDRLHIPQHMHPHLSRCYIHHLARLTIMRSLQPSPSLQGRLRVPTSFLHDQSVVDSLTCRLVEFPQQADEWWKSALIEIKTIAFRFNAGSRTMGIKRSKSPSARVMAHTYPTRSP